MPIGDDTFAYRRYLPHLAKQGKTYFVTFTTRNRSILSESARDLVLASCIHDHGRLHWLDVVVVMPDHVHLLTTPYDATTLDTVVRRIKAASAHRVNQLLNRTGSVWRRESFDHILRSDESREKKADYIFMNPVRAGLVSDPLHYPWTWRPAGRETGLHT